MTTNSTPTLYDADTAELIGPATPAQHDRSNHAEAVTGTGIILIDEDGDVVDGAAWYRGALRRVYTMGTPSSAGV